MQVYRGFESLPLRSEAPQPRHCVLGWGFVVYGQAASEHTRPMTFPSLASTLASFMEDVWNQGDVGNLETYLAPAYTIYSDPGDPWEGQTLDRDGFHTRLLYSRNAFPDLRFDIQESIEGEDTVAIRWMMSGTHLGDLPNLPATGRSFSVSGMTFYSFDEGQICGHRQAFDQLGFLSQTGSLGRLLGAPPDTGRSRP